MKCLVCRFRRISSDKAFLAGVVVARLFGDPKTAVALRDSFKNLCPRHASYLDDLKGLRLLHLSEAIVSSTLEQSKAHRRKRRDRDAHIPIDPQG